MATRVRLGDEFVRAIHVRGLTLTEVAHRAGVSLPTASAAVHHRPLNTSSALRLCRAVAAVPIVPELDAWVPAVDQPAA